MHRRITVLVPDQEGVEAFAALPHLEPVRLGITDQLPSAAAVAEALVVPPGSDSAPSGCCWAAMPDGAVLVNASRGDVVDTAALLTELSSGRLGAALVVDPEPLCPGHPLGTAPGLLIPPVGALTRGGCSRAWAVAAEQLTAYARGLPQKNRVVDLTAPSPLGGPDAPRP